MAEMLVVTPEIKKIVEDYDVVFESGMMMPITIDITAGDTVKRDDVSLQVRLVAKPSPNNPKKILPAEDILIFLNHVVSIQHREREVTERSPEETLEWQKIFNDMTNVTPQ